MWLTALIMGFAGSLHCLGMCSPLAMAVTNFRGPYFINKVAYNGGRILCYGVLGSFVGGFGSLFRLSGFQGILTVALGCSLILIGLLGSSRYLQIPVLTNLIYRVSTSIRNLFSKYLQQRTALSLVLLGGLNGLLPCGLTYLALTYCLSLAEPGQGFLFMLVFGAGTLPAMLGLTTGMTALMHRLGISFRNFTSVAMIVLGVLLIARTAFVHDHPEIGPDPIVICK